MYGYLENFSSLFDLNPSDRYMQYFEQFEQMVQKCAVAAVRDTRLTWKNNQDFNSRIDLNIPLINKIIVAYKNSCFGSGLETFYIRRVRDEFIFLAGTELKRSCHNQAHYDLILPVIFFRCIMQNEFNPESVQDRQAELKKQLSEEEMNNTQEIELSELPADYFNSLEHNEKWINRRSPWVKNYDSGELLTAKLYQLEENKTAFHKVLSSAEKEAMKADFYTNEAIPLAVRIACAGFFPLKDHYEDVKYCSEYSRIGCFLFDLLEATANKDQTLDTILRLYMITQIHDVLISTGYIIRGEAYSGNTGKTERPLLRFNEVTGKKLMQYVSEDVPMQTAALLDDISSQKHQFLPFFDHLYTYYTFNAPEILELYLDKAILEPCIGVDQKIKDYAANVTRLVSKLPYYQYTVAHARTAIRMSNLFREDKLEASWKSSEDYAILQEANELLDL